MIATREYCLATKMNEAEKKNATKQMNLQGLSLVEVARDRAQTTCFH